MSERCPAYEDGQHWHFPHSLTYSGWILKWPGLKVCKCGSAVKTGDWGETAARTSA